MIRGCAAVDAIDAIDAVDVVDRRRRRLLVDILVYNRLTPEG
jgi:hypothetical protein